MADLFRDQRLGYLDHAISVDFSSDASSVSFGLLAGETMIHITGSVVGAAGPAIALGFLLNGDNGPNYDNQRIEAEGAAALAVRGAGANIGRMAGQLLPAGRMAQYDLLIMKPLATQPALAIARLSGFEDIPSSRRIYAQTTTIWRNSVDALSVVTILGDIDAGSFIQVERNIP